MTDEFDSSIPDSSSESFDSEPEVMPDIPNDLEPELESSPELVEEPEIEPTAEIQSEPELEPELVDEPEVEPTAEIQPEPELEPELMDEPEIEPVAKTQLEPESSPELTSELTGEPKIEPLAEIQPDLSSDRIIESKFESATEIQASEISPELKDEPVVESAPEIEPEQTSVFENQPEVESTRELDTEPSLLLESRPEIEPALVVDSDVVSEQISLLEEGSPEKDNSVVNAPEMQINSTTQSASGAGNNSFVYEGNDPDLFGTSSADHKWEYRIGSPHDDFRAYANIRQADSRHELGVSAQTGDSLVEAASTLHQASSIEESTYMKEAEAYVDSKYGSAPYTDAYPEIQSAEKSDQLSVLRDSNDGKEEVRKQINSDFAGKAYSLDAAAAKKVEKSDFLKIEDNKVELDADKLLKILKSQDVAEKYPEGVQFDQSGYPDFSPYIYENPDTGDPVIVEIDMKGNHTTDYTDANRAAGIEQKPEGYTWHHHQDGKTMILVPTDLHGAVRHTGGVSTIINKDLKKGKK